MKTKQAKRRRKKQDDGIQWREGETTKHGNARWFSMDGMFQLVCQDRLDDIPLERLWVLWQFKRGSWWRVYDHRSRRKLNQEANRRAAELLEDGDDE